ncbi:MAG TPA: thioredoxin [Ignavibacteria bacterium]|mgnify:CR=1 FL=1|nr:thioredoxin [Ignavibacteria bacterium]
MKSIVFIILVLIFGINIFAQGTSAVKDSTLNKTVIDSVSGKPMLIGYYNRKVFADSNFSWWFRPTYQIYTVDTAALKNASRLLKNVDIIIVMGTWCSDSRMEVPHFYKILDYLKFPSDKVKLIMVDRDKKAGGTIVNDLDIDRVPTIIFSRAGKEIGRIIEYPRESYEIDMMRILRMK